jgi:hypothetical protein
MTTVAEFAEQIGVRPCDVDCARMRLKKEGEWPGEELKEPITYRSKLGKEVTRRVISLSPEQQEAVIGDLIEMVESGRTRIPEVIEFVRTYKEQKIEGGVPQEAWSPRDRERMERGERPKGYPDHPNV